MPPTKHSNTVGDSNYTLTSKVDVLEIDVAAVVVDIDDLNTTTIPGINSDIAALETFQTQVTSPNSRNTEVGGSAFAPFDGTSKNQQIYNCTLGNGTQEMPDAITYLGRTFTLTRTGSSTYTLTVIPNTGFPTQKIAGRSSIVLTEKEASVTLVATLDGLSGVAGWRVVSDTNSFIDHNSVAPTKIVELPPKNHNQYETNVHAMVVKTANGQLLTWGDNTRGSLSIGLTSGVSTIQPVIFDPINPPSSTMTIQDWCFTGTNLYVLMGDGTTNWLYSCGENTGGQLGHGDTTARTFLTRVQYFITNSLTPTKVWAAPSIGTGTAHGQVVVQCSNGKVFGCGWNSSGSLGIVDPIVNVVNTFTEMTGKGTLPATITIQDVLLAQSNGTYANYILTSTGDLYAAGINTFGNLGDGSVTQRKFWVGPVLTTVSKIRMGHGQGAITLQAIKTDNTLWSWGQNTHRQVKSSAGNQSAPLQITLGVGVVNSGIFGGFTPSCWALDVDGYLWTWGYNATNNLFYSDVITNVTTPQPTPTKITALGNTITKVWGPSNMELSAGVSAVNHIFVQKADGSIRYSSTTTSAYTNGSIADTSFVSGSRRLTLPYFLTNPNSDGFDQIEDVVFNYGSTAMTMFFRTRKGRLYSFGNNTTAIASGGNDSTSNPANLFWNQIRL